MTRALIVLGLFAVLTTSSLSQQTAWQQLNPLPQGNLLNAVSVVGSDTVIAVGALGTIIRSNNGGATWRVIHNAAGVTDELYAVQMVSPTTGWAVGEFGRVVKTTDGGITWFTQEAPAFKDLYAVHFVSPTTGWVGGSAGRILSTTDGGATWREDTSNTSNSIFSISFRSATEGTAVGSFGTILNTTNGGLTWSQTPNGTSQALYRVQFVSPSVGFIVGSFGTILKTIDGGANWFQVGVNATSYSLYAMHFTSSLVGTAVGLYGTILRTTNSGSSWFAVTSPTGVDLYGLRFGSSGRGWAVGDYGTIIRTTDGATWSMQSSGVKNELYGIHFPTTLVGFAVGDLGTVARSTDGGRRWTEQTVGSGQPLYGVHFVSPTLGWVVGDSASILRTTNGGFTWTEQNSRTDLTLYSVYFVTNDSGWAVGDFGKILRTTTGGSIWASDTSRVTSSLLRVKFLNSRIGWAVGYSGTIVKTTNAGRTWINQSVPGMTRSLYSLEIIDANNVIAGGDFGLLFRSTDGGTTWTIQNSNTDATIYGIAFFSPSLGWAAGDDGVVTRTTDGGTTWAVQHSTTTRTLFDIQVVRTTSGGLLFAAGEGGTIICSDVYPLPSRTWTGTFDSLWTNPGNWNPIGVPQKVDSVYIPSTTHKPVIRGTDQLLAVGAIAVAAGSKLTIGPGLSTLTVKGNITLNGTLEVEPGATTDIIIGGSFSTLFGGRFVPGNSTVTFTSKGQCKGTFYNLYIKDSAVVQTVGNIQIQNRITLLSDLAMRPADTLAVLSPDPNSFAGGGIVRAGTILRTIQPGLPAQYRFESAVTFVRFLPDGTLPTTMAVTAYPNTLPFGLSDTLFVKRYYNVTATGGSGYLTTLSLRYDLSETKISIENLALFRDSSDVLYNMGVSDFNDSDIVSISLDSVRSFSPWYLGRYDYFPKHPFYFLDSILLSDNGSNRDTLFIGAIAGATNGIDSYYGEVELGPIPPAGTFDARWEIPSTQGTKTDVRDYLTPTSPDRIYTIRIQPGPAGYPINFRWDSTKFATGSFFFRDKATQGGHFSVNMKMQGSYPLTNSSINRVEIVHKPPLYYTFEASWNMVSLPLIPTSDGKPSRIFPTANSPVVGFSNGYVIPSVLTHGKGYWVRLPIRQTFGIEGIPIVLDTLELANGWNMIGSINRPVSVNSIVQIPPNIVRSMYFAYANGYVPSDSIRPARAYWVKIVNPGGGKLVLSSSSTVVSQRSGEDFNERLGSFNVFTIRDGSAGEQRLYFGTGQSSGTDEDLFELPPSPPGGVFDARFSSGRMVHATNSTSESMVINLQSSHYPVKLEWQIKQSSLQSIAIHDDATGELLLNGTRKPEGILEIVDPSITRLIVRLATSLEVPAEFSLKQNFPNPFNPSTRIEFDLPLDAVVNLTVFNILGQEVTVLARDQMYRAGSHSVTFDPNGVGSGIYFYRISARTPAGNEYQQVKKMVLLH